MGPAGLKNALPRGGRQIDDYPANLNSYMDGLLKLHWTHNKSHGCTFTDADEMSQFVSQHFLLWR